MARSSYAVRIRTRIAELEQQVAAATSELAELRVAEKVLGRFSGDEDDDMQREQSASSAKEPTIPDLIIQILNASGPLETAAIFNAVNNGRSTPTSAASVQSTLSRVKASGKIGHDGSRWYVVKNDSAQQAPQTNEAPEGASEVSLFE